MNEKVVLSKNVLHRWVVFCFVYYVVHVYVSIFFFIFYDFYRGFFIFYCVFCVFYYVFDDIFDVEDCNCFIFSWIYLDIDLSFFESRCFLSFSFYIENSNFYLLYLCFSCLSFFCDLCLNKIYDCVHYSFLFFFSFYRYCLDIFVSWNVVSSQIYFVTYFEIVQFFYVFKNLPRIDVYCHFVLYLSYIYYHYCFFNCENVLYRIDWSR